jgi:hypothetical protein
MRNALSPISKGKSDLYEMTNKRNAENTPK